MMGFRTRRVNSEVCKQESETPAVVHFIHFRAHCLNLAFCHVSEEPVVRIMMSVVQEVALCEIKKLSQMIQKTV